VILPRLSARSKRGSETFEAALPHGGKATVTIESLV
jgi:hypothetical protein